MIPPRPILVPTVHDAAFSRAFALHRQGRLREALDAYNAILAAAPAHASALHYSGLVLHQAGQSSAALPRLERAVALEPRAADAWGNLALVYSALGRTADALRALEEGTRHAPRDAVLWENYAAALLDAERPADAERAARRATSLDAYAPGAWYNLALALERQQRLPEARQAADRAVALAPEAAQLLGLKASLTAAAGDLAAARALLTRALDRSPHDLALRFELATLCERAGDLSAAAAAFEAVLATGDGDGAALSQLLFLRKRLADWHDLDALRARFRAGVQAKLPLLSPFCLLSDPSSRALQRECAQTWSRAFDRVSSRTKSGEGVRPGRPSSGHRLTIGYLSADFHMHATALLTAGLFEHHDRQRYNVAGYSTGRDDGSPLRKRLVRAFDRFVDAQGWSAQRIAEQIRSDGVDILVDLKGHTDEAPTGVLARRAAPVQVAYLGYPGTTGAPFIDYVIGDAIVSPLAHAGDYTETLVLLPHCYQVNDVREIAPRGPRDALGLPPPDAPVLCCFNETYKIAPEPFDAWMSILRDTPRAVLWLLSRGDADPSIAHLRAEAAKRGVGGDRIVFAHRRPNPEYLALYAHATLFVDTWPYNGHTTASDALWAGCPVVTLLGETFAGRVGASVLTAVGLPELVARDPDDYGRLVRALLADRSRCDRLRAYLEGPGRRSPLFDTARTTQALERAYDAIYAQHLAGAREPIVVEP